MNCDEARRWLSPYLDSELCATKTYEVSEHLRNCPACAARFDAERRADALIAARLANVEMPDALWSRVGGAIRRPAWLHRIGPVRGAAIAASLLVIAAAGWYAASTWGGSGARPAVVAELVALAPDGTGFVDDAPGEDPNVVFTKVLGVAVPAEALNGRAGHHPVRLISAHARQDDAGREFVELRMACCGQAVLVLMARDGEPLPDSFAGAPIDRRPRWRADDVHLESRRFNGIVAVAASYHTVQPILDHLRVVPT